MALLSSDEFIAIVNVIVTITLNTCVSLRIIQPRTNSSTNHEDYKLFEMLTFGDKEKLKQAFSLVLGNTQYYFLYLKIAH